MPIRITRRTERIRNEPFVTGSVVLGGLSWLVFLSGLLASLLISDELAPKAIMSPRTFFGVSVFMGGSAVAGLGLLASIVAKILGANGRKFMLGMALNLVALSPMLVIFVKRAS